MNKMNYHNRNGDMHSEESREHYLQEQKEVEHEFKKMKEIIEKLENEDYQYFSSKEEHNRYIIKYKKSGFDRYKTLKIKYGENFDKLKDRF